MPTPASVPQRPPLPVRVLILARKVLALRPLGIGETESIMQFSRLGTLTCLCDGRHAVETDADRREVCRGCGGQALATVGDLLDRYASTGEIRAMTASLRLAGIRARGLEIPATVHSLDDLHRFLDEYRGKKGRKPPRRPNAPVALSRMTSRMASRMASRMTSRMASRMTSRLISR